ncbi:pyridoxamine 5'-phosphate oxidase family protein [Comamonas sp. CMM03]|uniref:pyridoxamine 5'-phosphate oxidase family protein n=1 Tax=Comamonas sp. CMM03 TaxID=2854781 RepID=UPI001C479FFB|nr:pyridoxamine 5'-phosphate oxidase family protein [Comamonas sp. CMM03]MBV7417461.1 pyridoxamine 5'-phosphate oxidase family protein [Comamonas sp. CMM03]
MSLLTSEVHAAAKASVLCWLATVDADGQPNVSPKEIWTLVDDRHVVVAHIASPVSVRNVQANPRACLSFVDVFAQKGFKLQGAGRVLFPQDADFERWAAPLYPLLGPRFPLHAVLLMDVNAVQPIVAPSYHLFPATTTEAGQIAGAMQRYGVQPQ